MSETRSCTVILEPEGTSCEVPAGTTLQEAATRLGVTVNAPCGGEGTCGKCRVKVVAGEVEALLPEERALLSAAQIEAGLRLACRARLNGPARLSVPAASRAAAIRVLPGGSRRDIELSPWVHKQVVRLDRQTLEGAHSRLEHLRQCGDLRADLEVDVELARRLPALLPYEAEVVTAVLGDGHLLEVEAGDTAGACYGLALDLGTTTVVANLVDLGNGKTLGNGVTGNRQSSEGHDVIARINFTLEEADGLAQMQRLAVESLEAAIAQVLEREGIDRRLVYDVTLVGNATMMHLCLGVSPASLGHLPYAAVFGDAIDLRAGELGLDLHPAARVHVLPNIAGFVGADTVGAILAAGLDEDDGRVRVVADIGTNCELALRRGEKLIVTSTPAGPAFEGARISCGMYAVDGAIESVRIGAGAVDCKVIGKVAPQGLCGSALVDAAAEMLRAGIVDETGRILGRDELDAGVPESLRERVIERSGDLAFALAYGADGEAIALTQRDVRELQLAKAAIRSGIDLLLERGGVTIDQVDEFCIAGGFGNYLDKENAIRLGLIPPLPLNKLRYIGNGALVGANLALLSRALRRRGQQIARQAEHLQIAGTPGFQMRFGEAMLFDPEPR
ncbi:MAG: ASKHA domain-containing protein [Gemmatimonadota bacterium]